MQLWSITEDTPLVINHVVASYILLHLMSLSFVQYHSFFTTISKDNRLVGMELQRQTKEIVSASLQNSLLQFIADCRRAF